MATPLLFEEFLKGIRQLGSPISEVDEGTKGRLTAAAAALRELRPLTREAMADLVKNHPDWVPALAHTIQLSQEQFKNQLKYRLGTSGWTTLARTNPGALVDMLDDRFGLLAQVVAQRDRMWDYGEVLVERAAGRARARRGVSQGRKLEDRVQRIVEELNLSYVPRTKFAGRGGAEAPADFAIPAEGRAAKIVIGVKGFDSTGSKLTDAVREVEEASTVRLPRQFVFFVIDGIGWLSRQSDLKRIFDCWDQERIDGLYTSAMLGGLRDALEEAKRRLDL
ncbi:DpnII family type II restriction endonuclease [Planctomycetota bacterium]